MTMKRRNRKAVLKSKGSVRKSRARVDREVLDGSDWTVGQLAWNKDGNVVILDPRLAQYLRAKAREDRELEIGIPPVAVRVGAPGEDAVGYDPSSTLGDPAPRGGGRIPQPLSLCACDFLRFHLATEGPVEHKLLSNAPVL